MDQNYLDGNQKAVESTQSEPLTLNAHDGKKIGRAALYSMLSALCGFMLSTIPALHVPPKYAATLAALIPVINILLVTAKQYFDGGAKVK